MVNMRTLFLRLLAMSVLLVPSVVFAGSTTIDAGSTGLSTTGKAAFGDAFASSSTSLPQFIGNNIIQPVFGLIGLGFFCLTVYAGVLWMTARGQSKQVDKAKDILTAAVIGAVIVVSSYVLTNALLSGILTGSVATGTDTGTVDLTE